MARNMLGWKTDVVALGSDLLSWQWWTTSWPKWWKWGVMNWKVYIPTNVFFFWEFLTWCSHAKKIVILSSFTWVDSKSLAHHYDFQTWSGSSMFQSLWAFFFWQHKVRFFFKTFPLYQLDVGYKIICPGVDASACRLSSCTRRSLGCSTEITSFTLKMWCVISGKECPRSSFPKYSTICPI